MKLQRGGTLLGFVLGLLVGLGAALAVAVYVTKVPVPFANKNQPRASEQDEAETKKNRDWDPNATLQSKTPARPVAPAATPASRPEGTSSAAKPAPAGKADGRPDASADPLGDLAKAKSKSGSTGADPFSYFVQAGAFRTQDDAEAHRAKLSLMGLESRVTEREQSGRTVYRVRIGPLDSKDAAEQVQEKLDSNGIESALVRVQR